MQYMVVERFKEGAVAEVYRRFAIKGRMTPPGLDYLESWVSEDLSVCFQLMETSDLGLFALWTREWEDLVEFEIVPLISSSDAREKALAST